jgi:hypothetical protein
MAAASGRTDPVINERPGVILQQARPLPKLTKEPFMSSWSLWSRNSFLSVASDSSALSVASVGSFASFGSIGSFASALSVGSSMSLGSALSNMSRWSILSNHSQGAVLSQRHRGPLKPSGPPLLVTAIGAAAYVGYLRQRKNPEARRKLVRRRIKRHR